MQLWIVALLTGVNVIEQTEHDIILLFLVVVDFTLISLLYVFSAFSYFSFFFVDCVSPLAGSLWDSGYSWGVVCVPLPVAALLPRATVRTEHEWVQWARGRDVVDWHEPSTAAARHLPAVGRRRHWPVPARGGSAAGGSRAQPALWRCQRELAVDVSASSASTCNHAESTRSYGQAPLV